MFRAGRLVLSTRAITRTNGVSRGIHFTPKTHGTVSEFIPKPADEQRANVTLKRFWKKVDIAENSGLLTVTLDKRALRTPEGAKLEIPSSHRLLASLIAIEWENQEKLIKPHALPMTSIASRAIDGLQDEGAQSDLVAGLIKYFDTDTVCFHESHPPALVQLQEQHWIPLLKWAESTYKIKINIFDSLLGNSQPKEAKEALMKEVNKLGQWEVAAFERAVLTTKSFIIALALVKGRINVEQAAQAAHVEVVSQTERWGEVEDTHDVDHHDIRRQLGSVACVLATN
ncbi:Protein atp12, mitochondrial OS=Schizosaccharomyces pombe (strain 972 / ATCC 24843) GN=atp12 PE=3 SV=2 [Rhizoctonia solani AG-1 IB]|uniref:Protein atp12, mitochondrial n=1 Tax=Thanatephorus cucumeris (strain AG1-IB / isolate 7/3/14) TaxID=1108050 RepID=A0A0B7F7L1_THACB|nr:Protein atp12, mitochondrial OS=Schizosaccharomyces pombe (strain 972 / ATCC 24843) GN=atp12 PE=3 SV=2 [Rhizoctonia solani AG-1 IB]